MSELKYYLRKFDFPKVVSEALHQLLKVLSYDVSSSQSHLKEVVEEYVFFEVDKRGNRRAQISSIYQLHVLNQLCAIFTSPPLENKIALFLLLFPPTLPRTLEKRLHLLSRLISMSTAVCNGTILSCVGILMQVIGCHNDMSLSLTKCFVEDYFIPLPNNQNILNNLSNVSPLFCASFLAALGHVYSLHLPPPETINIILEWLKNSPSICFAASKLVLPPFCQFNFVPQSLFPALMLWTVILPFTSKESSVSPELHSKLHLTILQSMLQIGKMQVGPCDILSYPHLFAILERLKTGSLTLENKDIALNRLAQIIQIALTTRCLPLHKEHLNQLFIMIGHIGYNRLLSIVHSRWRIM